MSTPTTPAAPGCDGTRVTGYVDEVLSAEDRAAVEAHLASCDACRDQEAFERGLRQRMRTLPVPELPAGLEARVRREIRRRPVPAAVRWLPLAAGLALAVLWGRGAAPFVAWELARDHAHCFARERLKSEVWTSDSGEIAEWYRQQGTEVPPLPSAAGGVELVGGRFCPLLDRKVAHLYYAGEKRHLSVFVVPGPARFGSGFATRTFGENVRLLHTGGTTLALVGEDAEAVDAFHRALSMSRADASPLVLAPEGGAP
jgi:anti-sigma factor RsiW